jgi:hypothetical protein
MGMTRAVFVLSLVFIAGPITDMDVDGSVGDLGLLPAPALATSAVSTLGALWAAESRYARSRCRRAR